MDTEDLTTLVHRARGGDAAAWDTIVDEYTPLLWSVVRGFRLSDAACADAVQRRRDPQVGARGGQQIGVLRRGRTALGRRSVCALCRQTVLHRHRTAAGSSSR